MLTGETRAIALIERARIAIIRTARPEWLRTGRADSSRANLRRIAVALSNVAGSAIWHAGAIDVGVGLSTERRHEAGEG